MRYAIASAVLLASTLGAGCGQPEVAQVPAASSETPQPEVASTTRQTDTHVFEELADGVYFATGTGTINVASNALVIVNETDVLIVDSHITADAGRALLDSVHSITDKPIKYLVNSHFHFDHAHGNQVFAADADIFGHEYTRERLSGDPLSESTYQVIGSPQAQGQLLAALDAKIDAGEGDLEALRGQRAMLARHIDALDEVVPTPPNVTFYDTLTLRPGGREIRLIHPGRGHTGGDVIVYLPAERVVFTGDLLYPGAPYLGDGYADEFPATLEVVKALEVDVIAGGHGPLMRDKSVIDRAQAYLRTYWSQVAEAHGRDMTVDEALDALDLSGYEDFATFQLTSPGVLRLEVARMYERLNEAP